VKVIKTVQFLSEVQGIQEVFAGAVIICVVFLLITAFARHLHKRRTKKEATNETASNAQRTGKVQAWLTRQVPPVAIFAMTMTLGLFVIEVAEYRHVTYLVEDQESEEATSDGKVEVIDDNTRLRVTLTNSEVNPSSPFLLFVPDSRGLFAEHDIYTYESLKELQEQHPEFPDSSGYIWAVDDTDILNG